MQRDRVHEACCCCAGGCMVPGWSDKCGAVCSSAVLLQTVCAANTSFHKGGPPHRMINTTQSPAACHYSSRAFAGRSCGLLAAAVMLGAPSSAGEGCLGVRAPACSSVWLPSGTAGVLPQWAVGVCGLGGCVTCLCAGHICNSVRVGAASCWAFHICCFAAPAGQDIRQRSWLAVWRVHQRPWLATT